MIIGNLDDLVYKVFMFARKNLVNIRMENTKIKKKLRNCLISRDIRITEY
jgi:hypothetical protein